MSQEEQELRSQSSPDPCSVLEEEVNTEGSDNLEWDNYREDPSFIVDDPDEDLNKELAEETAVQAGRVSSTDDQFIDRDLPPEYNQFVFDYNRDNQYSVWPLSNLSSESVTILEENLLPKNLLVAIDEEGTEDEVFFDNNSLIEEVMGPKAPPTLEQLHDKFDERVVDFNEIVQLTNVKQEVTGQRKYLRQPPILHPP